MQLFLLQLLFVTIIINILFTKCTRYINRVECIARNPILNNYTETLNGIITIRAFDKEKYFFDKLRNNIYEHYLISLYKIGVIEWFMLWVDLICYLYLVFIVLYLNKDYSIYSAVSLGVLLKYSISFCDQLCAFIKQISNIQIDMVHFERCEQYCNVIQEKYFPNKPKYFNIISPVIEFKNYTASYRGGEIILKKINIVINAKEKIGIVGRTGSGKSSLINAIFRIFESKEGQILISGIDISKISLVQLRKEICIVPQEPLLFDGTLRFNLDPKKKYDDYEIRQALDKVNCHWELGGKKRDKKLNICIKCSK